MRKFVYCFVICCHALLVAGQTARPLRFHRLGIEDGLPDANITCLEQDDNGFLWIGTTNGLSRYDGATFKNFSHQLDSNTIAGNHITTIRRYGNSHLLIATTSGLSILNTLTLQFKNYIVPSKSRMFALDNWFFTAIADKDQNIWAGTKTALYYLSPQLKVLQQFKEFDEDDYNLIRMAYALDVHTIPGDLPLAFLQNRNWDHRYFVIDRKAGKKAELKFSNHTLEKFSQLNVYRFVTDNKSRYYFIKPGTDSLLTYEPVRHTFKHLNYATDKNFQRHSLKNATVVAIDENDLAAVYARGGFSIIPYNVSPSSTTSVPVQLPDLLITALKRDKEGNLWAGTENGLYKCAVTSTFVTPMLINPVSINPNLSPGLRQLFFIDTTLWISSNSSGYFTTNRMLNQWQQFTFSERDDPNITWSIVKAHAGDTLWANTQFGIRWIHLANHSRGKLPMTKDHSMDSLPITALLRDSRNLIWMGVGFGNGLVRYDPTSRTIVHYTTKHKQNPLPIRYPLSLAEDYESNLWMGNQDGAGLVRWRRTTDAFELITPDYKSTFNNGKINTLYCGQKDVLWIGTTNGLFQYHILSKKFTRFDAPKNLRSAFINSIAEDETGRIWIGTTYGLSCYLPAENRFLNFTAQTALPEAKVNDVVYDSLSKKIFFTTDNYVASFTPSQLLFPRIPLTIKFTSIFIGNEEKSLEPEFVVPYRQNEITLFFTAVNLTDGQDNEYSYRINGKEWIALGRQRQLRLANLSAGQYTIDIKAINGFGNQSLNRASLHFRITRPFWQTWWLYLTIAVLIGIISYAVYRYRVRQLLKWQKTRDRIATDLHDDIGSTLTNISILSELSSKTLKEPHKAQQFLQRISEEVHASSQAMDDIIWSVNSRNDSLEETVARMRRYAADLFDSSAVNYHLHLDEQTEGKKLNMEQRRDVYLIYKESLNNVYKHSGAKNVWVSVRQHNHSIKLSIKDDGKGFCTDTPTHRNGLKNLVSRVNKWNGKIEISSRPGAGTSIGVEMPVKI